MRWEYEAEQLRNNSTLGRRQAQVAVLTNHEYTPDQIVELIEETEGDAPEPGTIQSIQSKLYRELLDAVVTHNIVAGGGLSSVRPPEQLRGEHETPGFTVHAYTGGIGSGKTVTAQSHAVTLAEKHQVDDFIVLDFLDAWEPLENQLPGLDRISVADKSVDEYDIVHGKNTLVDKVESRDASSHTVVYITEAHYLFSKTTGFVSKIQDHADNLSLRLITQTTKELPDVVEPDTYQFHRSNKEHTKQKIQEIQENTAYEPSVDVSELPQHFPSPHRSGDAAYMVTGIPETGETMVRANVLTEHEKDILIG